MAGAGLPLSRDTTLDFGYRYIDLGKVEIPAGGAAGNLRAHELTIGVRF